MKRLVFLSFILFYFVAKQQAQNLIRNGSFENISPPQNWNNWSGEFITFSQTPSQRVLLDWDEENSSDLFTSACTHTWSGVPMNIKGSSQAKAGNNYVGFMLFANGQNNDNKEYIYQLLSNPLQSGKIYCLSFFVSRADRKEYAIENIGAFFSNNVQTTGSIGYINKTPQVVNQSGLITDTIGWTEIQGCFTANGGEQYITIGNFNSDANTNSFYAGTNNPIPSNPEYCYYYIDDITLIDQSTVGLNELDKGKGFDIYPSPSNSILNIKSNNQQLQNATIEIKNTLGQLVYFDIYAPQINISDLPSGIYFLTINNKETKRTIKFVKD
jgi:OOP family OmpA-OmpF porin